MTTRYDHPNCIVRREARANNVTGVASTTFQKFMFFQKAKLKAVHSLVVTAGTNDAAGVDIYVGTTSIGAITHGTDAALSVNTSGLLDVEIPANSFVDLRGKANSATMVNSYVAEYEVLPDAEQT
jgi:hypothetical protein